MLAEASATQIDPPPAVMPVGSAPTAMVWTTGRSAELIRETVPSRALATQMSGPAAVIALGPGAHRYGLHDRGGDRVDAVDHVPFRAGDPHRAVRRDRGTRRVRQGQAAGDTASRGHLTDAVGEQPARGGPAVSKTGKPTAAARPSVAATAAHRQARAPSAGPSSRAADPPERSAA